MAGYLGAKQSATQVDGYTKDGADAAFVDPTELANAIDNAVADKATVAYVDAAVASVDVTSEVLAIVDAAPDQLNTLNELAAALGDDANFASTVTNQIANEATARASADTALGARLTTAETDIDNLQAQDVLLNNELAAETSARISGDNTLQANIDTKLPLAGGTMSGSLAVMTGSEGQSIKWGGTSGRYVYSGTDGGGHFIEQVGDTATNRVLRIQTSNGSNSYTQLFMNGASGNIGTNAGARFGAGTATPTSSLHVEGSDLDWNGTRKGIHMGMHAGAYAGVEMVSDAGQSGWIDFRDINGGDFSERIRGGQGTLDIYAGNRGNTMAQFRDDSFVLKSGTHFQQNASSNEDKFYAKNVFVQHVSTGATAITLGIMRIKRHWWGSGNFRITTRNMYYSGSEDSDFQIEGHCSIQYGGTMSVQHMEGDSSGRIYVSARQEDYPAQAGVVGYTDVYISVPAYNQFMITVEVSGSTYCRSDDEMASQHNCFRMHRNAYTG